MSTLSEHYDFRARLTAEMIRDLVGPPWGEEVRPEEDLLLDDPVTRYGMGALYPRYAEPDDNLIDPSEDLDAIADDDDEIAHADPPIAMAHVRYPSSMGLTCAVDSSAAPSVTATIRVARYEKIEGEPIPVVARSRTRRSNAGGSRWQRVPGEFSCDVATDHPTRSGGIDLTDGLRLFFRVRPADPDELVSLTVGLVDTHVVEAGKPRDAFAWFQVELELSGPAGTTPFQARPGDQVHSDEDLRSYDLLYRDRSEFATGHGCSVTWTMPEGAPDRAASVRSTFTPTYDLTLADSNPAIQSPWFSMLRLATAERSETVSGLRAFVDQYDTWIDSRDATISDLPDRFGETAVTHLDRCRDASTRMRFGIDLLAHNDDAFDAFRLANRAMSLQRARTEWLRAGKPSQEPDESDENEWRPFQLGFILLTIAGIADPKASERELVDLLWFPTGGGKTEAYLGLIAFTTFLRRLRVPAEAGAGVTVFMRYTLRLLTLQQFERAALLICACEALRREQPDRLGETEISIGLWVGRAATPNTLKEARASLDKARNGTPLPERNPMQLLRCPWCGIDLDHRNYWITEKEPHLVIACRNGECDFRDGLPAWVVDEDLYKRHPTLVIATADKFACLPWRPGAGAIFNRDSKGVAPPELVIQDELHLISGPLGTLAGLYETAIDLLGANADGVAPKVIASTATIRRAAHQVRGIFARDVRQFPPPGLDAGDSWFAVDADPAVKGNRRYVGVMSASTSHTTLLVRTYAALLQYASELDGSDDDRDPYWTLLGYFNSLRVLGGARVQVQDDVADRMKLLAPSSDGVRNPDDIIELTSREPSTNIPQHLERMANSLPSRADRRVIDVILATNMISVGVDIDRLGLMAVMGQPQSASEYIQATSRVGRRHPGLVVVMFNSARSRDRSHYESFEGFHSMLYRQVDATSVTPFSTQARRRGLHAVLIGLARLLVPDLTTNGSAGEVRTVRDQLSPIAELIVARARSVSPDDADDTARELDEIIEAWEERASEIGDLYFEHKQQDEHALLREAADREDRFATLWSLRDVDTTSNLFPIRS